jgi:dolichyl-phosphate-mannose--protein O-mannosyl transferase
MQGSGGNRHRQGNTGTPRIADPAAPGRHPGMGVLAGWGPWFPLVTRTKFYYYALEFEPFLILAITLCLGLILGPTAASVRRLRVRLDPGPAKAC